MALFPRPVKVGAPIDPDDAATRAFAEALAAGFTGEVINVVDPQYATNGPINLTGSTSAAALNANNAILANVIAAANPGDTILFPAWGCMAYSATIDPSTVHGIKFFAYGRAKENNNPENDEIGFRLKWAGAAGATMLQLDNVAFGSGQVEGIVFDLNDLAGVGVDVLRYDVTIKDCSFHRPAANAEFVQASGEGKRGQLIDCVFRGGYVAGTTSVYMNSVNDWRFSGNRADHSPICFDINGGGGFLFTDGNHTSQGGGGAATAGIRLRGSVDNVVIVGNYLDNVKAGSQIVIDLPTSGYISNIVIGCNVFLNLSGAGHAGLYPAIDITNSSGTGTSVRSISVVGNNFMAEVAGAYYLAPIRVSDQTKVRGLTWVGNTVRSSATPFNIVAGANGGVSTATAGGTNATSVPVANRSLFPASGNFDISIGGVRATVTGGHGSGAGSFTISAPATWTNGHVVVELRRYYAESEAGNTWNTQDPALAGNDDGRPDMPKIRTLTTSATVQPYDHILTCSGTINVTLPIQPKSPTEIVVKNTGVGTVTVVGTIDGAANILLAAGEVARLVPNGSTFTKV